MTAGTTGVVARRLVLNWRVDPEVVRQLVPEPFRPLLRDGSGVAGICFLALRRHRPRLIRTAMARRGETAAHRFAVEWDDVEAPSGRSVGHYVPRRDATPWLNRRVGGQLFPAAQEPAGFTVEDDRRGQLRVSFASHDGAVEAAMIVRPSSEVESRTGLFVDLDDASAFIDDDSVSWSESCEGDHFVGVELRTSAWRVEPLTVVEAESSFFQDPTMFPAGSAVLDGALLMRDTRVDWHPVADLPRRQREDRTTL